MEGVAKVRQLRRVVRGVDRYDVEADPAEAGESSRGEDL